MRRAVSNVVREVRDALACKHLRWQSQRRGRTQARACLAREDWLAGFRGDAPPGREAYVNLFRYFVAGFVTYRSPLGAHADYVGLGSYNGPAMDRLEGFSRLAPLVAAWLHGGRTTRIDLDGRSVDLIDLLRVGLVNGTDPASPEYWGQIRHWGQAIVEAADIALVLWLTRPLLWDTFSPVERSRISSWLGQVNHKRIPDNNWHLFVVQVNAVLAALGEVHDAGEMDAHYQRAKSFHRGEGWFRDGEREETPGFDYYNAWGFHYQLQWIDCIAPGLDGEFIATAFRAFVAKYAYLLGPEGISIMGRSACYRMAAAAPLVLAQAHHADLVCPGQARRALDVIWSYFIRHGSLAKGNVSQGYFAADASLLENYSGPASCLWSLRSLIPAFALPDDHPFWIAPPESLPVELGDYLVDFAPPGWNVRGNQASLEIILTTRHAGDGRLQPQRLRDRLMEWFSCKPRRPDNLPAKYYRPCYASSAPYGIEAVGVDGRPGHLRLPSKP